MSAQAFGPYPFALTEEEARAAIARAALRRALSGGLTTRHLAPLAAFVLALMFAAILGWSDLITRRHAEIALLIAAALFMVQRILTRQRFMRARRESAAIVDALRAAGALVASVDDAEVRIDGAPRAHWHFRDCLEAEDAGGMIYLWPKNGPPAILPTRIFGGDQTARDFVAFARSRIAGAISPPRP